MRARADQHRALKALISGMKTVIERTAPAPGRSFSERRATTSGQINTRIIAMRVSENDAREILSRIEHEKCSQGINGHWSMYRGRFYGDTNGTNQPSAQSICWLYCWAKTGQGSDKAARQAQKAFDDIFDHDYDWLSGRLSLEEARRLRYAKKDIESEFNGIISTEF